jgi:protein-arginine kinase activator protein McsA
MEAKECSKCKQAKPLSAFAKNPMGKGGRVSWCKTCMAFHNKIARRVGKEKFHALPKDRRCEICQKPTEKLNFDHDHSTGKFRGWLCHKCNTALGLFHDSQSILETAISYLARGRI